MTGGHEGGGENSESRESEEPSVYSVICRAGGRRDPERGIRGILASGDWWGWLGCWSGGKAVTGGRGIMGGCSIMELAQTQTLGAENGHNKSQRGDSVLSELAGLWECADYRP
ncbi:hypothetical protein DPX16_15297 [Anabarilius grahami]|uniref:Uncharacterized protein n=1 Tax=Anabarilius grahami TaxID=495550 RepID=A0A3N0XXH4_ANAGA|nr:hypothetical protein DPX16_15297 [Anabarilius grahami]